MLPRPRPGLRPKNPISPVEGIEHQKEKKEGECGLMFPLFIGSGPTRPSEQNRLWTNPKKKVSEAEPEVIARSKKQRGDGGGGGE